MARKRILCVEDNDSNMRLVSRIVEGERHEFLGATDGVMALDMARREKPDLILLDINIPGLNGLELARLLKADKALAEIPLIATTANVLGGDRERCLEAGCDEYLPKPLDIRELQVMLRHYIGGQPSVHPTQNISALLRVFCCDFSPTWTILSREIFNGCATITFATESSRPIRTAGGSNALEYARDHARSCFGEFTKECPHLAGNARRSVG